MAFPLDSLVPFLQPCSMSLWAIHLPFQFTWQTSIACQALCGVLETSPPLTPPHQLPAQKGGVDMPSGCPKPLKQNLPCAELIGLPRESDLSLGAASANGTSTVTGEVGQGGCLRSAEGVPKKWRLFQAGWG